MQLKEKCENKKALNAQVFFLSVTVSWLRIAGNLFSNVIEFFSIKGGKYREGMVNKFPFNFQHAHTIEDA